MVLAAIDSETQGLNAQKFIMGCLIREDTTQEEVFTNKQIMWQRIIDLGRQYAKRGKKLNIYGHNVAYDFYGIADFSDQRVKIQIFSERPFIAAIKQKRDQQQ